MKLNCDCDILITSSVWGFVLNGILWLSHAQKISDALEFLHGKLDRLNYRWVDIFTNKGMDNKDPAHIVFRDNFL